jgi:hypothetical protein
MFEHTIWDIWDFPLIHVFKELWKGINSWHLFYSQELINHTEDYQQPQLLIPPFSRLM